MREVTQTPMSQMKQVFVDFTTLVEKLSVKTELTGKDSKYNYRTGNESKGVESDFIRIYTDRDGKNSFAFAFNNYKENPANTQIVISVIENDEYTSANMNFEKFKERFKEFLKICKILKQHNVLTFMSLSNNCRNVFKVSETPEVDYKKISKELISLVAPEMKKFKTLNASKKKAEAERREADDKIRNLVQEYRKNLEKELKYDALVKKENKLKSDIDSLSNTSLEKLNSQITVLHEEHRHLTYRSIKNYLTKPITELLSGKEFNESYFWKDVFHRVFQNHQRHKD